ncbi:MAG: hypothetical protein ACE5HV_00260 [Acidobacteriota bacterium]
MSYPIILSQGWSHVAEKIDDEIARARRRFPEGDMLFAALVEEVGETAEALIEFSRRGTPSQKRAVSLDDVRKELVQVAAMAIRLRVEGDRYYDFEGDASMEGREV